MSHIITIFGGKDGVGKSTFAANFAASYFKEQRKKTLIIDLDAHHCGDMALIFAQSIKNTLYHFSPLARTDFNILKDCIAVHPSGLHIIQAYREEAEKKRLSASFIEQALKELQAHYDLIVIDAGSQLSPFIIKAFELSTLIFLITEPQVLALSQTKRALEKISNLLFPKEMIKVILNRFKKENLITPQMASKSIEFPLFAAIEEDEQTCSYSVARGQPFALNQTRSTVSQSYYHLVKVLDERKVLENLKELSKPKAAIEEESEEVLLSATGTSGPTLQRSYRRGARTQTRDDPRIKLKLRIHEQLIDTAEIEADPAKKEALSEKTKKAILGLLEKENQTIVSLDDKKNIVQEILDEALGLGPLEKFLADDDVTEIMVNAKDQIYLEKGGKIFRSDTQFTSDAALLTVIERIVAPLGRRIDEQSPYCDARLPDGSRVHAIIPPLSIQGPMLTIRKFSRIPLTIEDLIRFNSLTKEMADFFRACIEARLNIVIAGGTGSGKTTLLNVLSSFIPSTERILTIEDSAELQLKQPHIARLEARPPNIEGKGAVTIRDLVKNSLRMRPDRIIVGECRGGEALDMLQAMNTGHDGSLTTVHANSPRDCLSRLETLVMMAGMDLPARAIREQIASAINIIVQISRFSADGSRRVTEIAEITGMEGEKITMQDIFKFEQTGVSPDRKIQGSFKASGFVPRFVEELKQKGVHLPVGLFRKG